MFNSMFLVNYTPQLRLRPQVSCRDQGKNIHGSPLKETVGFIGVPYERTGMSPESSLARRVIPDVPCRKTNS